MGNNGLALAAGLLNGIGQGMQTAQDRALKQEYQKVMMDQHKLQGKMLEAKMKEMDLKSSIQPQLISFLSGLDAGGPPGPGAPNMAPAATPEGFTANPVPSDMGSGNRMQDALRFFLTQGYQPHQAAGIVGNLMHESGLNPAIPGDNGASLGLAQWNGPRRQALADFAATQGKPPTDFQTQLGFVNHELSGPESAAGNALRQARTLPEATQTFSQMYERPGVPAMGSRMAAASQAYNALPQMLATEQTRQQINSPKSPSDRLSITKMPIGKRVALDLMFKQMFDLDTKFRENKTTIKGTPESGYDIFDNDGNLTKHLPGTGKVEMLPYKDASGATGVRPTVIPPAGQLGGGPGMVIPTAPAPVIWDERTKPGGGKEKVAVPGVPQLGMSYQTEPDKGQNASEAGRIQLAQSGLQAHQQLEKLIFDPKTGKSNWGTLGAAVGPGIPWTEGRNIKSLIFRASDAIIRAATGAALNREELSNYAETYAPSVFDNEQTVQSKMQGLRSFLNGYLEKMDPTEAARLRMGPLVGPMGAVGFKTAPPPATAKVPAEAIKNQRMRYNPQTNSLEPVQ